MRQPVSWYQDGDVQGDEEWNYDKEWTHALAMFSIDTDEDMGCQTVGEQGVDANFNTLQEIMMITWY